MRGEATRATNTKCEHPALPAAGHDPIIHHARTRILHHHLPGLSARNQQNQQNLIATQLANIATQQQQFRQEDQEAKEAASARTVHTWLGDQAFNKLCGLACKKIH